MCDHNYDRTTTSQQSKKKLYRRMNGCAFEHRSTKNIKKNTIINLDATSYNVGIQCISMPTFFFLSLSHTYTHTILPQLTICLYMPHIHIYTNKHLDRHTHLLSLPTTTTTTFDKDSPVDLIFYL